MGKKNSSFSLFEGKIFWLKKKTKVQKLKAEPSLSVPLRRVFLLCSLQDSIHFPPLWLPQFQLPQSWFPWYLQRSTCQLFTQHWRFLKKKYLLFLSHWKLRLLLCLFTQPGSCIIQAKVVIKYVKYKLISSYFAENGICIRYLDFFSRTPFLTF